MIKRLVGWFLRRKAKPAPTPDDTAKHKASLRLVYGGLHLCDMYNLHPSDHAILDALLREEGRLGDPFSDAANEWANDVERRKTRRDN